MVDEPDRLANEWRYEVGVPNKQANYCIHNV